MNETKEAPRNFAKYAIGEKVLYQSEVSEVLGYSYDTERGYLYKLSSIEVDTRAKRLIKGIKHVLEVDLSPVKEQENE
jgi:hypothetical protein